MIAYTLHRPFLWEILKGYGIHNDIITIIQNMYDDSQSAVKLLGTSGQWFSLLTGVIQGCILSPLLFALVLDWIMKKSLSGLNAGLEWVENNRLCNLDFTDDSVLIDNSQRIKHAADD